jgi:starch synthase (maltosyl-transferring)
MNEPTLIYNLFPPLAGTIPRWEEHLDRIAAMGFTWIFLNPIHTPGLSGSLYAVKDYFGLNPLFFPESGQDPEAALVHFVKEAGRRGLKVMLDLVINHTAIDSPLTVEHPEWYAKDAHGKIKHPGAIDPADARKVTVWGDLAELEYWPPPDPEGLLHYWDAVISKYLGLGILGFRADAAYKIPGEIWARLITEARNLAPEARFFAETLGCRLEQCEQLAGAFDFIYNSSKWWDFQEDWCLEQYEMFRRLAPSISFPESHDTARLAAESGGAPEVARQRYLFAAYFSAGVMTTLGYEFGFKKRLNVVKTRPQDWETPAYDLTAYIAGVNRMKKACPVLLAEGPQRRVNPQGEPVVLLLKSLEGRKKGRVLAIINATREEQIAHIPNLAELLGKPLKACRDLTPDTIPLKLKGDLSFPLAPARMRILYNPEGVPLPAAKEEN